MPSVTRQRQSPLKKCLIWTKAVHGVQESQHHLRTVFFSFSLFPLRPWSSLLLQNSRSKNLCVTDEMWGNPNILKQQNISLGLTAAYKTGKQKLKRKSERLRSYSFETVNLTSASMQCLLAKNFSSCIGVRYCGRCASPSPPPSIWKMQAHLPLPQHILSHLSCNGDYSFFCLAPEPIGQGH